VVLVSSLTPSSRLSSSGGKSGQRVVGSLLLLGHRKTALRGHWEVVLLMVVVVVVQMVVLVVVVGLAMATTRFSLRRAVRKRVSPRCRLFQLTSSRRVSQRQSRRRCDGRT